VPIKLTQTAILRTWFWKVPGCKLGQDTGYTLWRFSQFFQALRENTVSRQRVLRATSFKTSYLQSSHNTDIKVKQSIRT